MFEAIENKLKNFGGESVQSHSGTIVDMLEKQLGPKLQELLNDDTKMRSAVSEVYNYLPAAAKTMISEDKLVEFVASHKDVLQSKLNS